MEVEKNTKEPLIGIYKITSPTNRVYVGQSIDIKLRWKSYERMNCKSQPKLYRSLIKYGFDNHKLCVIKYCEIDELNYLERYYQDFYNCLNHGLNSMLQESKEKTRVISKSTRLKMSESVKGGKHPMFGLKGELNPIYGVPKSSEHKEKLRVANLGKKYSDEVNAKKGSPGITNPFYGKTHSNAQIRSYIVNQSNKVKVIINEKEIVFECVQDCADYFNCTSKNILFRDKRRIEGIASKFGMFKGVYLEILK